MYKLILTLVSASVALALPRTLPSSTCREVEIPVTVSVPRFIINTTVNDNWDAAYLTFNLTGRDSVPLVAGSTPEPVESKYTIGTTLCGTGGPTLILTHGIIESKLYWRPTFEGAEQYSFVDAALAAGYSILSYDRLGVGTSSKVNALHDAQFQVQSAILTALISHARTQNSATKIALIGHSYGSYLSISAAAAAAASTTPIDALVLTGYSGVFDYFPPFVAGAGLRVARLQDPPRWGTLDTGYLTCADLYAETYVYFAAGGPEPLFEHRVAAWTYEVGSEPFAVGELPSLLASLGDVDFGAVAAPVLVLQGRFDVSACGGDCVGVLGGAAGMFPNARGVRVVDDLPAGHNLNLHKVAPQAFEMVFQFLKDNDVV